MMREVKTQPDESPSGLSLGGADVPLRGDVTSLTECLVNVGERRSKSHIC